MNINPAAAASVAGTTHAASRGGETDKQASEAARQQSTADAPAGKSSETAVEAGDQAGDRGGNGRQTLDVFEQETELEQQADPQPTQRSSASPEGSGGNLDLQA